jgi:IS1 family transposase
MNYGRLLIKKTLCEKEIEREYGKTWIWTALDSGSRLIICFLVGKRTLESCREYFRLLLNRIENKPLFVSDELSHYKTVLTENFSTDMPVTKTGKRGRPKKPEKVLDPELDYAVVHKTRENGRVVKVEQKIVFGEEERIREKLSQSPSNKINTAYVERSSGTLRKMNGNLRRKSLTFAKDMTFFNAKMNLIVFIYNFIKPHASLSKNSDNSTTPRTSALYAGIIDHNWTVDCAFKVPVIIDQ